MRTVANRPIWHLPLVLGLIGILLLLTWNAACAGYASLLSAYALDSGDITAANVAISLGSGNAETHLARGLLLEQSDNFAAAIVEYQKAISARPDDYGLWLIVAHARELNGEKSEALAAARQAIPLAPYYAQPHWQLGNILLRAGLKGEAFKELRLAGISDPTFMPGIIDLAWRVSGGDLQFVEQAMAPQTPESYRALGQYFRKQGATTAAVQMYAAAGKDAESESSEYLSQLLNEKRFKDAFILWANRHPTMTPPATILNPGFEQEADLDKPGFQWRRSGASEGARLSLSAIEPKEGHSSLVVDFNGDPGSLVISQLVLAEPGSHYQLRFSVRTENLVSGGLPNLSVLDAGSSNVLGRSDDLPANSVGWRDYLLDFNSANSTEAIQIALKRSPCSKSPCPIFGKVWLDGFSLLKR